MNDKFFNSFIISIICIVPLIITPYKRDYYYEAKTYAIYILCFFSFLPFLFLKLQKHFKENKSLYFILLTYILTLIISTFFSINFFQSLYGKIYRYEGLYTLLCYIIIFIISSCCYKFNKNHLTYLFTCSSIISIYGLMQYFGYNIFKIDPIRIKWIKYVYSTIGNPNFLGSYLVLILPLAIYCFIKTKKLIFLAISCLHFITLLLTKTRSAWIGFLISFLLLIFLSIKNKNDFKNLYKVIICIFIITAFINLNLNNLLYQRFSSIINYAKSVTTKSTLKEYSGSNRIFIWKRILKLIQKRPLIGYGPDTFDIAFMNNYEKEVKKYIGNIIIDKAHNEYLQIAVCCGIPTLFIYCLFLSLILKKHL